MRHPSQLLQQLHGRRHGAAGRHQFTHARQFVESLLRHHPGRVVVQRVTEFQLHQQRLEFVRQVAHGGDARHARAALEGVQRPLERRHMIGIAGIVVPGLHRRLCRLQQLGGLFTEDGRHFHVEIGRQRLQTGGLVACRSRGRGFTDTALQADLGARDARPQGFVHDEISGGFVEMTGNILHGRHAIGHQGQVGFVQSHGVVEGLAQPLLQGLREANAVARFSHLGAATQRVTGAVDGLRQQVRHGRGPFARQPGAHLGHVPGGFARVDFTQHGVRRFSGRRAGNRLITTRLHGRRRRHVAQQL